MDEDDALADIIDRDDNELYFNGDHFEHIDYLSNSQEMIDLINKHKLKGKVTFGCLDGDQWGEFWGY